jgi:hypothetical protein
VSVPLCQKRYEDCLVNCQYWDMAMSVNVSGWDEICSSDCDKRYMVRIGADPSPDSKQSYRDMHINCINKCFKVKPLS